MEAGHMPVLAWHAQMLYFKGSEGHSDTSQDDPSWLPLPLQIMLAIIRLHGANADIMITLSTPEEAVDAAPPQYSGGSMNSANDAARLLRAMVESLWFHDKSLLS